MEQPIEARVEELLGRMTLEEKLGQLAQDGCGDDSVKERVRAGQVGSFLGVRGARRTNELQHIAVEQTRLGIPLIFGDDIIHGYATTFPIPLAESASFDPAAVEQGAAVAAREGKAAGVHWTFAPMVDIARDPRWGRIAEGAGEDPWLGCRLAEARVRGFQGADPSDPEHLAACAKHFVAYGAAEGGRDYNTVDISEQTLRDVYLPPFRAAVRAGVLTLMSAFNELNGTPASANAFTLTQILRREWGFRGFVVSDCFSVAELLKHGVAATRAEAGALALCAGVEMDMASGIYQQDLARLVEEGRLDVAVVDEAVRRVLRIKFLLGLFEHPYADEAREAAVVRAPEHRAVALAMARRSLVLLKNEGGVLPLRKNLGTLAVIGPLADNQTEPLGTWACAGEAGHVTTVLAGLKAKLAPTTRVLYAQGCDIEGERTDGFAEAVEAAREADAVLLVLGESAEMSGEAHSRSSIDLPGVQEALLQAVVAAGKPVTLVLMNGRPLAIAWAAEHVPAILEAWHAGETAGEAIAEALLGETNPGGKLPVSFPRATGQIPAYYNHKNTGRPALGEVWYESKYRDLPLGPLFPFGHGLSYTTFELSDLSISPDRIGPFGRVTVSATVANTGARAGDEVVQLYIRDLVGSVARPVRELKGFRRVSLAPGERQVVEFTLGPEELGFHNARAEYVVEPGHFQVWVGNSSVGGLEGAFEITA